MKTKMNANRWIAMGTLGAMTLSTALMPPTPAHAVSADTWKKVAIGAGVVTGYGLLKGKGRVSTIGGLATAGSYYMYKKEKKQEDRDEARRRAWYQQRYGSNWRNYYRPGV